jgi:hypothetical protein
MMRELRLVLVIAILAVANGCGGASSQVVPPPTSGTLLANPTSISFGNVGVGTTGTTQNVTLSAIGGSVSVTAITGQTDFVVSNVAPSLPATVSTTQSLTFQVAFKPGSAGLVSSPNGVSVVSNATNSPTEISLSGTGTTGLIVSTTSLSFGSVTEGTTSPSQNIMLTASGQSFNITSITVPAPFVLVGGPLGTLGANASETVQVAFAPTTTGAASGTMTVTSNAPTSPSMISLSGTGTSGANAACVGISIAQIPAPVTTGVAPGITVTQATSLPGGAAGSWNTYADLPSYSAPAKVMVYNYGGNPNAVASANLDGTDAQIISGSAQGTEAQVTPDGQFAFYEGLNQDNTADIYAVPLAQSGNCVQNRLSNLNLTPIKPEEALIISNASIDSTGHNVIAFSEGMVVHRVYDDGTLITPDPITLQDPENTDVFHRMRLNPKFPNIMWYKRDAPSPNPAGNAQEEIWIVDLNNPGTFYSLSGSTGPTSPAIDHASWSNDGTKLGYIEVLSGLWWVADVLNPDGTFNVGANNTFTLTQIGPPSADHLTVDFCNLSPDSSVYVCAQGGNGIYLMSPNGSLQTPPLLVDPGAPGAIYNGIPKPQFLDMQHILYSSDSTGLPQIYILTGFWPITF